MKTPILASLFVGLALAAIPSGFGQTVTSDPAGFVTVSVQANSDAILAVPMYRTAAFKGVIQSISGNTITVAGTSPGWTTDQFVQSLPGQTNTYAVLLATGAKEGMIAKVTANAANTVTVQFDSGDDFTGVNTEAANGAGNGDHIDIMPYWTPLTLFTGATIPQGTQILFFNGGASPPQGVNLSSTGSFGYDSGSWVDENTFETADHAPLGFGRAVILRNPSASVLSLSMVGSVPMAKHRFLLRTLANNLSQDIFVGYSSPIPEPVGNLSLGFAEDDQLLVFNNAAAGQNKSASQVLYYTTGDGWVDDTFTPVGSTFMLQPGQGYIFRKKATANPTTVVWQDLQGYLQ